MISCVAVVVEVIGEDENIVGVAGGHFVTPSMFKMNQLTKEGDEFINSVTALVDGIKGVKQFAFHHTDEADGNTWGAMRILRDKLKENGIKAIAPPMKGKSKITYLLNEKGQRKVDY